MHLRTKSSGGGNFFFRGFWPGKIGYSFLSKRAYVGSPGKNDVTARRFKQRERSVASGVSHEDSCRLRDDLRLSAADALDHGARHALYAGLRHYRARPPDHHAFGANHA